MPITRTPIIDDDGTGTTGTVIDNAWKTELYNQIDGTVTTPWVTVPFNAAYFWPGVTAAHIGVNSYTILGGKTMIWVLQIAAAPVPSPALSYLYCILPTGTIFGGNALNSPLSWGIDAATGVVAGYITPVNATTIGIRKADSSNWAGPTCYAYMTLMIGLA